MSSPPLALILSTARIPFIWSMPGSAPSSLRNVSPRFRAFSLIAQHLRARVRGRNHVGIVFQGDFRSSGMHPRWQQAKSQYPQSLICCCIMPSSKQSKYTALPRGCPSIFFSAVSTEISPTVTFQLFSSECSSMYEMRSVADLPAPQISMFFIFESGLRMRCNNGEFGAGISYDP